MRLRVRDAPWSLIGRKRVAVEADVAWLEPGNEIRLTSGKRLAVVTVDSVARGADNTISLDLFLRENLGVEIGQSVDVEALGSAPDARAVNVSVQSEGQLQPVSVQAILQGSIVWEGAIERHLCGAEELMVTVGSTEPPGLVRVTALTRVKIEKSQAPETCRALQVYADGRSDIHIATERPAQRFADVGGLEDVKTLLTENLIFPMQKDKAELFAKMGYRPPRGVLLHGPPGTGKTLLARATAGESNAAFISVPGSKFKNKWYGETERMIREVFKAARDIAPCIVFIDEIDAIAYYRDGDRINVINQLLVVIDELRDQGVFVIGATNLLPMIDPALLQPSRLLPVEVKPPDSRARENIFRIHLKGLEIGRGDIGRLVRLTEGRTGAQIELACNRARMAAMREQGFSPDTRLEARHILAAVEERKTGSEHFSEYM